MKTLLFACTILAGFLTFSTLQAADRPNIILMMADDMGWSDIGCYGGEIDTPNIDRIASEGLLFTQFYNNAKCTTTRSSLLTGHYPPNGGRGQSELIPMNVLTLGEAMRHAGYATGMSGKWHNGKTKGTRPYDRGFDDAYGLWDGCCNFFVPTQPDPPFKGGRIRPFGRNDESITEFPEDFYTTDAFAEHTVETIRKHAKSGESFFHYVGWTAPHYPLHAKPEDIAKYKGRFAAGWDVLREQRLERQLALGLLDPAWTIPGPEERMKPWAEAKLIGEKWQNLRMETYAAMVDSMDQGIGSILAALDEEGIADNTMVIFLSDNGACAETPGGNDTSQIPGPREYYSHVGPGWAWLQNTPFRLYKATCHEGGVATPMVVRWPAGIEAGQRTDAVGHIIDFLPTFLEMAGADYPTTYEGRDIDPVDGLSLLPVLTGNPEDQETHESLCWHWSGSRAVRQGDWKLVWYKSTKAWELYDLSVDRTEMHDLASQHPEKAQAMAKVWNEWANETGVKR